MTKKNLNKWMKACKGSGGIISVIAQRLDVERATVYDYIKDPIYHKYLIEAKEEVLDIAESHILKGINQGDKEDIKWYLSRMGKNRGYVTVETQVNVGTTYKFEIIKPNEPITYEVEAKQETASGV